HGIECQFAADGDVVAVGKLAGENQRVRLGEEDQRIVDHFLFAVVEIVIGGAAVAGHIDGQNQQLALAGEAGIGLGFNDWSGGADFAQRLDAFQHLLAETRVAGRDLELGLAGNAVHGIVEGAQHAAIGGLHADEQGHAEHDAGGGEHAAEQVLADVGPTDEAEEDHRRTSPAMRASRSVTVRAQLWATPASWVTIRTVAPSRWCRSRMRARISAPVWVSRFPVGSSASRMGGEKARARAMATRWRSPPESSSGR